MNNKLATLAVTVILAGAPAVSGANGLNTQIPGMGHATSSLQVSATIVSNCLLQTSPLDFGTYDPLVANSSVDLTATTTETATCTQGAQYTLSLQSASTGNAFPAVAPSGSVLSSVMHSGSNASLQYTLVANQDVGSSQIIGGTGFNNPQSIQFTGMLPHGQDVPTGAYSDTLVATLNF